MIGHTVVALLLISITAIVGIRSQDRSILLDVLKEVEPEIDQLIAPKDRQLFYSRYFELYDLLDGLDFGTLYKDLSDGTHDNKTCQVCNQVFTLGKALLQTPEIVTTFGKPLCKNANTGYDERICDGLLDELAVHIVYMLQNTKLDTGEVCAMLLHPDCLTHLERPMTKNIMWELDIPPKKGTFKPLAGDGKPMKMLQMSDLHVDLAYREGYNAQCGEPVCCRIGSPGNNYSAHHWGEVEGDCDTPIRSAETYVSQMAWDHPDLDFVIWNGDTVPHNVWEVTRDGNLEIIQTVSSKIALEFKNIPVLAALGNHEPVPVNLIVPSDVPKSSNITMSWLYDKLFDEYWSSFIPRSSETTFKKGGYYSRLVKPNLKAIVLNSNACDRESYWIVYSPVDMDGQLKWLIEELADSESKGLYTIILGHVPPSDCYLSWYNNYLRIIERYEEVLVGHYFGHTHKEELFIFYNKNASTGVEYPLCDVQIPGSITTFTNLNPSYRVYQLDSDGRAQDFTSYYTDLQADNARGADKEPVWQKLYSAKESYGLSDLSTKSWDQFITRAKTDDKLTKLFYNHYHKNSSAYLKFNADETLEKQRKILQSKKIMNPIYDMLPPIGSN